MNPTSIRFGEIDEHHIKVLASSERYQQRCQEPMPTSLLVRTVLQEAYDRLDLSIEPALYESVVNGTRIRIDAVRYAPDPWEDLPSSKRNEVNAWAKRCYEGMVAVHSLPEPARKRALEILAREAGAIGDSYRHTPGAIQAAIEVAVGEKGAA